MKESTGLLFQAGTALSDSNIRYLSHFSAPDPFLLLRTATKNYLVVSNMEKGRAVDSSPPNTEVYTPADLGLNRKGAGAFAKQAEALIRKVGLKSIQVPTDFPVGLYQTLEKKGIRVDVLKGEACPERKIKRADEIDCIRKSQQAAVAGTKAAIQLIDAARIGKNGQLMVGKEVLTSERVKEVVLQELNRRGCSGAGTIIAGGVQATDPHERGSGPLRAGESIIMDIFPQSEESGYWGDMTRTVCRGPASKELKRLYQTVKDAQLTALRMVRPGICADEIHVSVQNLFIERGYETKAEGNRHVGFIHGTGHGVGLDIHESPRIGRSGEVLVAGHVVTVEPGLYYPHLGGVRIEDTVLVTEKGWRYLAPCEKKFELR